MSGTRLPRMSSEVSLAPTRLLQVGCIGQLQMGYFFGLHREDASIGCRTLCLAHGAANTKNQFSNQLNADEQRTTQPIILPPHINPQVENTMPRHPTKSICKTHIRGGMSKFTVCSAHRSRTSLSGEIGQILLFLEQTVASSQHSLLQHEQDLVHLTDRGRP